MGWLVPFLVLTLAAAGCGPKYHRQQADHAAQALIEEKRPMVPNMGPDIDLEEDTTIEWSRFPVETEQAEFLGADAGMEVGAFRIALDEALAIAVEHSRSFKAQKELVYLQALDLALARYRFTPVFSSRPSITYRDVIGGVDRMAQQHSVSGRADLRGQWFTRSGGRLVTDFTADFVNFLSGDLDVITSSRLAATFSQPLLRGAGRLVAMENLTQAERDLLYTMRAYVQFRKAFSVQVASAYYEVLGDRDTVRNEWRGLQSFRLNVEREEAFAEEGRRTQTSLGQLQQAEFATETRWINAVRNYKQSLDQFKLLLGVPVEVRLVLEVEDLERLEIDHPELGMEEALEVAAATRLDLYNERDQVDDAARQVRLAADRLRPGLNLVLAADVSSTGSGDAFDIDFESTRWRAGLDSELPLDRRTERTVYRASLIRYEQAQRALDLAIDQVKLEVSGSWRNLDQARRNYEISELGVELSERRVEEQQLLTELGRGTARDLVDAQTDLINAQNARTGALVRHTLARLDLWRDMGVLYILPGGEWKEVSDE